MASFVGEKQTYVSLMTDCLIGIFFFFFFFFLLYKECTVVQPYNYTCSPLFGGYKTGMWVEAIG